MSLRSTIVLIFLFGLASARANLIVNGGFETTVTGTVSGNNVGTIPPIGQSCWGQPTPISR